MIPFYDDETLEDLRADGLRLIQKKDGFRFGEDSVFLAAFAASLFPHASRRPLRVADLASGCGPVALFLSRRLPAADIACVELVPRIAAAAERNFRLNGLSGRLHVACADLRDPSLPPDLFPPHRFDLVVSNPPYRLPTTPADPSADGPSELVLAREEATCRLEDVVRSAAALLAPRGRLAVVYGPERLPDLLEAFRRHGLEASSLRLVQPAPGRTPSCVLVSAIAGGRPGGFRVLAPLVVRDAEGRYGDEAEAIYGHAPALPPDALAAGLVPSGPDPLSSLRRP
jgi:tRNA1(Val) A37 N6-methylase TrmN6